MTGLFHMCSAHWVVVKLWVGPMGRSCTWAHMGPTFTVYTLSTLYEWLWQCTNTISIIIWYTICLRAIIGPMMALFVVGLQLISEYHTNTRYNPGTRPVWCAILVKSDKNLSTFEPKRRKQQACEAKAQNGWTTVLLELECENKEQKCSKLHQWVSRRELVD